MECLIGTFEEVKLLAFDLSNEVTKTFVHVFQAFGLFFCKCKCDVCIKPLSQQQIKQSVDCPGFCFCLLASSVSVLIINSAAAGGMAKVGMGGGAGGMLCRKENPDQWSFAFVKNLF